MRDVAAVASLQCTNLPRGQRAIPGKADRYRVNSQPVCCCFLSLEVSSKTPHSPSLCIPGRDAPWHREGSGVPKPSTTPSFMEPNQKPSICLAGDYFGILMEAKVTSFPFSILDNPMYWGSTAVYLGWSLM